ncbi:hypothetical protein [Labrenzia sp. VG12]|uniref:hypothetical protein n=1 Tax=Labrenzia sp. VG12 TaxID=2021862 RepID=UPI000B8BDFDF|nr:hypothetical protein [Labrenzia sp. VG12]ASP35035.1 hypothetical protein CHH27_18810 [Labrenzia sp. VG12]
MTEKFDKPELYRKLGIPVREYEGDTGFSPEKAFTALKDYFETLDYDDLFQNNWGRGADETVLSLFDWTKLGAMELVELAPTVHEAIVYLRQATRAGPYEEKDTRLFEERKRRIEFWSDVAIDSLPVPACARFHHELYQDIFAPENFHCVLKCVGIGLRHFVSEPEAFDLVRHFIENFVRISAGCDQNRTYWYGRDVSRYLKDLYAQQVPGIWPLLRDFWCGMAMLSDEREFLKVWELCAQEPDRYAIGEAALSKLINSDKPLKIDITIADFYLQTCSDRVEVEALHALTIHVNDQVRRRGFFWLTELFRDRPSTFEAVMETARRDPDAKRRQYAFRLAFFHYFDSPDHVARLVEVAWSDKENLAFNKSVLVGEDNGSILPSFEMGRILGIASRGTPIRRARMFQKACWKAGVDPGVKIVESPRRALMEAIDNMLDSSLSKKTIRRISYKMMSAGERKFLNEVPHYQAFSKDHQDRLKGVSRRNAEAIEAWLEIAWEDALLRFGYGKMASNMTEIAFKHLLPDDRSEPAERLRAHFELSRTLSNRVFDVVHGNAALENRQQSNSSFYSEIAERAFFLLQEGRAETVEAAIRCGIEDAVDADSKRKFQPRLP